MLICFDLTIGNYELNIIEFLKGFFTHDADMIEKIVMIRLRIPKSLTCVVVGACLGVSGYYMQSILKNPIASPFTLGISAAASCGASFSILTGFPFVFMSLNIPLSAAIFSIICCVTMLVAIVGKKLNSTLMALFGVALNFFFLAIQSLLQYMADEREVQKMVNWVFGTVAKADMYGVTVTAINFLIFFIITYRYAWDLNVLNLSDDRAKSMGLDINKIRIILFIGSSIMTAVAVSYVGTIGFIGLLAPHLAKYLVGSDARYLAPLSSLLGSALMLMASIISKTIIPGGLLPIGIITNIIGVPFLATIVFKRKKI